MWRGNSGESNFFSTATFSSPNLLAKCYIEPPEFEVIAAIHAQRDNSEGVYGQNASGKLSRHALLLAVRSLDKSSHPVYRVISGNQPAPSNANPRW